MSSIVFDRIAKRYSALGDIVARLQSHLARQAVDQALRIDSIADFIGVEPEVILPILEDLVGERVLVQRACPICPTCDVPLYGADSDSGSIECDLCDWVAVPGQAETEQCYFLTSPVVATALPPARGEVAKNNPLCDGENLKRARIAPWKTLGESDYTISVARLDAGPRDRALELLQRFGIARIRWQGDPPSVGRLLSLEQWIGPARAEQNDFQGKVKALKPNFEVEANTGDSGRALPLHVDGTQDDRTPPIVAFQYDHSPTWGGESTFVDLAAVLADLRHEDLERILVALAQKNCAKCSKTKGGWTGSFSGPLVRSEDGGTALSIRFRPDSVLTVNPGVQGAFDELRNRIEEWEKAGNVLSYTPHEGDIVVFDNWRLLHGRAEIGGRHQRIHDRMWIGSLLTKHVGIYSTGLRGLGNPLMHAVERANAG